VRVGEKREKVSSIVKNSSENGFVNHLSLNLRESWLFSFKEILVSS
jgi:hypothetical protein